jgi:hypothetical protein
MNGWQIMAVACWLAMCGVAIDNPTLSGAHGMAFAAFGAGTLVCMILGGGLRGAGGSSRITSTDNSTRDSHNTSHSHNTAINYTITNHHHAAPAQDIGALVREVEAMRLEMQAQARLSEAAAKRADGRHRIEHAPSRPPTSVPVIGEQYRGQLRATPTPRAIEAPKKSFVLAALRHMAKR